MSERPLLMIPGPIEISDGVRAAAAEAPLGHLAPDLMASMAAAIRAMRAVWCAPAASQPFIVPGSGTLAMEMAATNLLDPGQRAVVVVSGFFSDRMATMLVRRGVLVTEVRAEPGDAPDAAAVAAALERSQAHAVFATHVDTSTGVRVDAEGIAQAGRARDALVVFDGVCATAGERFEMEAWDADVYLTASQKAIGLPPGLALMVASPRALEARARLQVPPPLTMDWQEWAPVLRAYEAGRPAYFATPATTLIRALEVGLDEILAGGGSPVEAVRRRIARHATAGAAFRAAWRALGLELVPRTETITANTLSAIRYPPGVSATLIPAVRRYGVVIAGGLHPAIKDAYFRVGHMGDVITRPADLVRTVRAIGSGLLECGASVDVEAAVRAFERALSA